MVGCIAMFLESNPRLASSVTAGKKLVTDDQCFLFDHGLNLVEIPGSCCVLEPGGTNRFDLCHASGVRAFDTFRRRLWYIGDHPCRDTTTYWTLAG